MEGNRLFNFLCFLLIFPFISIAGNSLSFYIFILIILFETKKIFVFSRYNNIFYFFIINITISSFYSYYVDELDKNILGSIFSFVRYLYWLSLSLYIVSIFKKLNLLILSKYITLGVIFLISSQFVFFENIEIGPFTFKLYTPRNFFIYTLIISIPFTSYYSLKRYGYVGLILTSLIFLYISLSSDGRAGFIIIFLQLLYIFSLVFPKVKKTFTYLTIFLSIVFVSISYDGSQTGQVIGKNIQYLSPRVGNLILGEGDGNLSTDKSWLTRKLMISKGLEIINKYPLFGVGPGNFVKYNSSLNQYGDTENIALQGRNVSFYNEISAHNSYLQIFTELGVFGFIAFIILVSFPLVYLLRNSFNSNLSLFSVPLVSLLGITIHFYVISSITGAISWFLLSLSWAMYRYRFSHPIA